MCIKIGSTDIKEVHKFCGVGISRDREKRTITLTQRDYINELAARYKDKALESYSPSGPTRASAEEFVKLKVGEDNAPDKADASEYMQIVGSILWVANMSRPDIAYYCSCLAMY